MNILIPHSWLKDFVKTAAKPEQIAEKLSLCSLSVERIHQQGREAVYEIEVTANRSDALSVLGVAREVNAVLPRFGIKAEFTAPQIPDEIKKPKNKDKLFRVAISDPTLVPRFAAIVLENVNVKKSPPKIRKRLELSGIRPLSNVVDVSNYLMLELGQPMHIFDFDKLGHNLTLRPSRKGEKITTLDGQERELPAGAIVIQSNGRLVDLCGIIGGQNSAVDEKTKRILLFVQIYDPLRIRKTSQSLALRTEASARFEKGIDPKGVIPAINKGITMLKDLSGARVASRLTDINNDPWKPHQVRAEIPEIQRLLGVPIDKEEIIQILRSLGFEVILKNSALRIPTIEVKVPSWRSQDIKIPADIAEEVARLYGYFKLPAKMPSGEIPSVPQNKKFFWEDRAKVFLKHQGFFEVYNYSFVGARALKEAQLDPKKAIKLKNPLNRDLEYLRPSLLPSLLMNLARNRHRTESLRLFELERVYLRKKGQELPDENFRLTAVLLNEDFYVAKGIVEGLLGELGIHRNNLLFKPHSENAATIVAKHPSGVVDIGLVAIENQVVYFDLDFDRLSQLATNRKEFVPLPKHPPVIEDLSVIVDEKVLVGDIKEEIEKQSTKNLTIRTETVDIYRNKKLRAKRQKSATFRLYFSSPRRQLSEEDAKKQRRKITERLARKFSAKVRAQS
jgi:phenylalanyl-tRNA synthetase beta chain